MTKAGSTATTRSAERAAAGKNRPLVDDIRLLGRILGDVIREQEGKSAFELVERVRQLSVAYRLKRDAQAGRALDRLLKNLSGDQTVSVIRAFSYFSHLANIAEDQHHLRRRAFHDRLGHLQEGSLAMAFERLARGGIDADRRLARQVLQQAVERAAGAGVALQAIGHRQPSHLFDQLEGLAPVLLADHVAEDAAEQADVLDQRLVLGSAVDAGHGARMLAADRRG